MFWWFSASQALYCMLFDVEHCGRSIYNILPESCYLVVVDPEPGEGRGVLYEQGYDNFLQLLQERKYMYTCSKQKVGFSSLR